MGHQSRGRPCLPHWLLGTKIDLGAQEDKSAPPSPDPKMHLLERRSRRRGSLPARRALPRPAQGSWRSAHWRKQDDADVWLLYAEGRW